MIINCIQILDSIDSIGSMYYSIISIIIESVYIIIAVSIIIRFLGEIILQSISEISSCFFGPRPWHTEIRHRVKKASTMNVFGFETLKLKIRRLKLWKPGVLLNRYTLLLLLLLSLVLLLIYVYYYWIMIESGDYINESVHVIITISTVLVLLQYE